MAENAAERDESIRKLSEMIKDIGFAMLTTVEEVERERHVNVSYAKPDDQRYVSVSGKARLVRDPEKTRELWNPAYKAWFPGGLDDPQLALLKITVERAEYWDSSQSAFVHLVGFIKAVATGEAYRPGENEKLNLKRGA